VCAWPGHPYVISFWISAGVSKARTDRMDRGKFSFAQMVDWTYVGARSWAVAAFGRLASCHRHHCKKQKETSCHGTGKKAPVASCHRHDTTPSVSRRWKDSRQAAVGAPVGQVAAATERLSGASRVLVVVDLQHRGSLNRNRRNDLPFNPHPPRKSREPGPCCQAIKKKDSSLLKVQQCLDVCWHLVEEGACLRQG
jgi:hypothetical protein